MTLSTFSKLCIWNHRTDTSRPEHRHARGVPRHLCAAPMNSLPDHLWQSWVKSVFLKFISSKSRARTALLWHFREARITFLALLFFFFWVLLPCQKLNLNFERFLSAASLLVFSSNDSFQNFNISEANKLTLEASEVKHSLALWSDDSLPKMIP